MYSATAIKFSKIKKLKIYNINMFLLKLNSEKITKIC